MPSPIEQSLNLIWVLLCAFLVMFMQVGFAMVETGFTRAKNAVHTMGMNFVIYPLGVVGFWLLGYGLMMGGMNHWPALGSQGAGHEIAISIAGKQWGLIGWSKFALTDVASDPANLTMFLYSAVFMDTAATIPTGAMAERWKFSAFMVYGVFISAILYPIYGNWVWGGGWLSTLGTNLGLGHGHVDFAGSSVVHMTGGVTALAGSIVLGPRIGKFRHDGTIGIMAGHNLPMSVIGTLVLAFGWFGFNTGSTLAATDARVATIAVNTILASASGAITALMYEWSRNKKPDIPLACNGLLGGLVAITAPCAFVSPAAAVLIGLIAGLIVTKAVIVLERRWHIDDPVGAIAVHGCCGAWGALCLGLLADGSYGEGWNGVAGPVAGLLYGDSRQFMAQLIGVAVNVLFVFSASFGFFTLVERVMGNRVAAEVEWNGLDEFEMGAEAYRNS
jgi:Amt family ammonium transporter